MGVDPYKVSKFDSVLGGAATKRGSNTNWEIGEVLAYYPASHAMDVRTVTGKTLRSVPRLADDPSNFTALKPGTAVAVSYDLPFPIVVGTLQLAATQLIQNDPINITGVDGVGASSAFTRTDAPVTFAPTSAPADLGPGDKAWIGTLGNIIALLEGGMTVTGSPNAQVRTHGVIGLLETIALLQRNVSSWGEWKIQNGQNGDVSFILRAGSHTHTQTGLDEENWTIRIDLGATGNVFNFEITTPTGQSLFKFHVGGDGRVQIFGQGGVDISSGLTGAKEQRQDIGGNETKTVGGSSTSTIEGNLSTTVGGASTEVVTTDKNIASGGNLSITAVGDSVLSFGGVSTELVTGGSPADASPGAVAKKVVLLNGGMEVDIGNPALGANISAQAGFELTTYVGDILFEIKTRGSFKAITLLPDSVVLGGNNLVSHVAKFEELKAFLTSWGELVDLRFSLLESQLAAHFMGVAFAAAHIPFVGPPFVPPGPLPFSVVRSGMDIFKSIRVGVGL